LEETITLKTDDNTYYLEEINAERKLWLQSFLWTLE